MIQAGPVNIIPRILLALLEGGNPEAPFPLWLWETGLGTAGGCYLSLHNGRACLKTKSTQHTEGSRNGQPPGTWIQLCLKVGLYKPIQSLSLYSIGQTSLPGSPSSPFPGLSVHPAQVQGRGGDFTDKTRSVHSTASAHPPLSEPCLCVQLSSCSFPHPGPVPSAQT